MYRLFIDETGHDNLKTASDPNERCLCVMGAILHLDTAAKYLEEELNTLKEEVFGTHAVVLHRREIIDKNVPPFDKLTNPEIRKKFDDGLLRLLEVCDYAAIAVLLDKKEHIERYKVWVHQPYHYCLKAMLERYVMHLEDIGDVGDVLAEWRGVLPNKKLEATYRYIYKHGTDTMKSDRFQKRLSSGELKIRKKEANIAGLQLVDLIVSPTSRFLQCRKSGEEMRAAFGKQVIAILNASKFRRSARGRIDGYGTKYLP